MEIDLEKSKYFGICSSVIRTNTPSLDINDFSEEDSLLPGWKIRIREDVKPYYTSHKNGLRRKKVYLTPHKKRNITTSLGVLEYLRLQGKSRKDLEVLAEHLAKNMGSQTCLYPQNTIFFVQINKSYYFTKFIQFSLER